MEVVEEGSGNHLGPFFMPFGPLSFREDYPSLSSAHPLQPFCYTALVGRLGTNWSHSTGPMRGRASIGGMGRPRSIMAMLCALTPNETTQLPHEPVAPGEGRHYDAFSRMGGEPKDRRMDCG